MQNPVRRLLLFIALTMLATLAGGCSVSDLGVTGQAPQSLPRRLETTSLSTTVGEPAPDSSSEVSTGEVSTSTVEIDPTTLDPATPVRLSTDPGAVYQSGTCLDVPAPGAAPTAVGCDAPHRIEIYAVQRLPGGVDAPFLGLDAAVGLCNEHFFRATGVGIGLATVLDRSVLRPSEATWSEGERDVICHVVYPTPVDRPLTAIDPTRGFGRVSIYGLRTGDCLADFDRSSTSFGLVPCDQPHNAEVFATVPLDPGDFPGDAEIDRIADEHCFGAAFEQHLGRPYQHTAVDTATDTATATATDTATDTAVAALGSRPTEETWLMGHHTVGCILEIGS